MSRTWWADKGDPLGEFPPEIREDVRAELGQIVASYRRLAELVGEREAHHRLDQIADAAKPAPRPKGRHNLDFDRDLLVAHHNAARGDRAAAIREVAERHKSSEEAARRRLNRLQREIRDRPGRNTFKLLLRLPMNMIQKPAQSDK
jgi:hypothetical protein